MERPRLTQREAAAACGVHLSTIRRYREAGRLPHAQRDPSRGWLIPVEDLLAVGLRLHAPAPPEGEPPTVSGRATPLGDPVSGDERSTTARLEQALKEERHRREIAELKAEYLAANVADLRRHVLALTPGPTAGPADPESEGEPPTLPAQSRLTERPMSGPVSEGEPLTPRRRWSLRRRT
ncbi:helix-turn-helix domain-containing protein [Streptomyces sp. H10-C2]|uniref:helix-turn-helix domain-containing protein n=1 Tax=unclassified Streptomyces TaxID=2593676 RepID=UPI0024BAE00E|nr:MULTISPECIES: helix-turn-helix domain-containing protein [unclassified Streptomyces]MDJ0347156.1 helix-turn-helix domain-containing protein [Streptomyces sp. PH10-H1]MDJ0375415.1 helix-turn-helix domain-containing protein [Streptomyces sp. H10-C2]